MLCRAKGRIVNRDDMLMAVWGTADFYTSRSLDVFVTKLRKYLSEDSRISLKALKGVGICLEERNKLFLLCKILAMQQNLNSCVLLYFHTISKWL